ncbi:unnamed protein product [Cercospora beticola]|nr:unnamed protein product [Cercospora beticola]
MFAARHFASASFKQFSKPLLSSTRQFHATAAIMVKAGDSIPNVELVEGAPDKKVNIANELSSGKGLIIGVPAAFSPTCTARHIPEYLSHKSLKDAGKVFVVAVNDPFVMKAWAESLDPSAKSGIRFLGDPHSELTKAWDLEFDSAKVFGQNRGKRCAITTENGKVKSVHIEPDNTGVSESAAEKVLAAL